MLAATPSAIFERTQHLVDFRWNCLVLMLRLLLGLPFENAVGHHPEAKRESLTLLFVFSLFILFSVMVVVG